LIKNLNTLLAVITSLICALTLFCQNIYHHLFVCIIGWKPEMSATVLHHSHVSSFAWNITITSILEFLWHFWLTTKIVWNYLFNICQLKSFFISTNFPVTFLPKIIEIGLCYVRVVRLSSDFGTWCNICNTRL